MLPAGSTISDSVLYCWFRDLESRGHHSEVKNQSNDDDLLISHSCQADPRGFTSMPSWLHRTVAGHSEISSKNNQSDFTLMPNARFLIVHTEDIGNGAW